jgi:ABC-type multidrug transport system ATPase subunit
LISNTMAGAAASSAHVRSDEVVVRLQNLTKQYGKRLVVDNLSLNIHRGEIFGFLGPNGAGKTTTIRMVFGLITPTAGSVKILEKSIAHHRAEVLPRVGALIEAPALYLYMSGLDNLKAVAATLGGVPAKSYDAILEVVGLKGREKDRVRTYSLGMKQRLGLAIALLQDPELLILDEPANGLDPAGIVEMRDLMRRLASEGKTVLTSSHLLAEVQQICSRVAIINFGKLVTETTIEDLTQGHGEYEVRVDRAQEALLLIQRQPWGRSAHLSAEGTIITAVPQGRGRELNAFLSQASFVADTLAPVTRDLEQVFLQLTNSHAGDVK